MQYSEVQKSSPESWQAFLRRIHEVHHYHADGTIDIYDSVEKYLHRDEQFYPMSKEELKQMELTDYDKYLI